MKRVTRNSYGIPLKMFDHRKSNQALKIDNFYMTCMQK
jgi:hypothetical protein